MSKENNFDLIRLLAALQVVLLHAFAHFDIPLTNLIYLVKTVLRYFPGVPIFFTISGFLICMSYEKNNKDNYRFFTNRFLRLYPGLWFSFIITVLILIYFGFISFQNVSSFYFLAWCLTQLSFFQFYTPEFFRDFGVGTPNGSLWTIAVEIQFYLLVPFIYHIFIKARSVVFYNISLIVIGIISYFFYSIAKLSQETLLIKLLNVSVLAYLYNFIIGIFIYKNFTILLPYLKNKFFYWLIAYFFFVVIFSFYFKLYTYPTDPSLFSLVSIIILSFLIIATAFSLTTLSNRMLKGYDISYGLYIYHLLIINIFIELGKMYNIIYMYYSIIISISISLLSWIFIEKKALHLKSILELKNR